MYFCLASAIDQSPVCPASQSCLMACTCTRLINQHHAAGLDSAAVPKTTPPNNALPFHSILVIASDHLHAIYVYTQPISACGASTRELRVNHLVHLSRPSHGDHLYVHFCLEHRYISILLHITIFHNYPARNT
jgi:hypothetical protein